MKKAFSLVELSIVLVILGLLVGGVLSGQSLIRAAELRAISTQVNQYTSALNAFRDKYFALAGDMTNATSFWGTATGCPNDGAATGVCNGDGDGRLGITPGNSCESQEVWRHLAKAGLVEGSYTTLAAASCFNVSTLGTNIPATRLSSVGITLTWTGNIVTSGVFPNNLLYTGNYGNAYFIGIAGPTNHLTGGNAFTTEEAWNIDTKMDDGSPDSGIVYSLLRGVYNTSCATSGTPGSADYSLDVTGKQCGLVIKSSL